MELNKDEMNYPQVTNLLNNMRKVSAPKDFETTLWRKINSGNYEPLIKEESWWERFLLPQRLIPSAALALAVFILFFVYNISGSETENPLIAQPKLISENVVAGNASSELNSTANTVSKTEKNQRIITSTENTALTSTEVNTPEQQKTSSATTRIDNITSASFTGSINKSGYNFLQIKLTDTEKEKVNLLKERIRNYFNRQKK